MSNAFNLSQLANFVDSSGKLNIATGSTGTVPTTQGGTGLTTVGTNGQVLQSNGTTLTWATPSSGGVTSLNGQTGAITDTTQYAIGSYVIGRPANSNSYDNSTVAGSSLYATLNPYFSGVQEGTPFSAWAIVPTWYPQAAGGVGGSVVIQLVNTGSWRCVSQANSGYPGLWVRYA